MQKKSIICLIIMFCVILGTFLLVKINNKNSQIPISSNDWIIIPKERIGSLLRKNLNKDSALKEIVNVFGQQNVKETEFSIGEGETIPGFSIYPDTENEIELHVNDNGVLFKLPGYNSYFSNNSDLSSKIKWKIDSGIKIGSSISDVQKINGKIFQLSGFEWDYPGVVSTWLEGELSSELSVVFQQTSKDTPVGYEQIMGDKIINSDNLVLQKTNPIVNLIYIKWNFR